MVTIFASWAAPRRHGHTPNTLSATRRLTLWRNRHRQRQDLRDLDPHMLRDIGLSRADVELECNKPFWRA